MRWIINYLLNKYAQIWAVEIVSPNKECEKIKERRIYSLYFNRESAMEDCEFLNRSDILASNERARINGLKTKIPA